MNRNAVIKVVGGGCVDEVSGVETVVVSESVLWEANMKRVVEYSLNPS